MIPGAVSIIGRRKYLEFIGHAGGLGNSLTLPQHKAGDLLIVNATNNGGAGVGIAAGWSNYHYVWDYNQGPASMRCAWRMAPADNSPSGTWSQARAIQALVFRPHGGVPDLGANANFWRHGGVTYYPALSLQSGDGTSVVVASYCGVRGSSMSPNDLAGTERSSIQSTSGGEGQAAYSLNQIFRSTAKPGVKSWDAVNTVPGNGASRSYGAIAEFRLA